MRDRKLVGSRQRSLSRRSRHARPLLAGKFKVSLLKKIFSTALWPFMKVVIPIPIVCEWKNYMMRLNCRIPGPAICILLNKNSNYCYIPCSSKHTDTCKWLGWVFCNCSLTPSVLYTSLPGVQSHKHQAQVVRKVDNAIQRISHYPVDSLVCFVITYPLDSDLSGG